MKFISIPIFIVSLAIGLFLVYVSTPSPRIIYVYPTPDNTNLFQYKDKAENCFGFDSEEVKCPSNDTEITKIPIQY